ncbi:MAG: glycine oxidase ThiO [Gemmatimonadetes bacterium]|nr:glycine oxidase ThiO [Gemmatimonadota bacterium]
MAQPDVLIVGGGIIGSACARALALQGVSVQVVDDGREPGAATAASAGMLTPFADAHHDDPMLALGIRGRDRYRDLAPELKAETGIDIQLWTGGIFHLAFTQTDVERLKDDVAWQRQSGYTSDWLAVEELRQAAPGVSPDAWGALLAGEDGSLDPKALHDAFRASAEKHGASFVRGQKVERVRIEDNRVVGVRTATESISAGAVLIAGGSWSGRLRGLPRPLSVEPIRGQMVAFDWPAGLPHCIAFGHGIYALRRGNEALAGSTMEHVGFEPTVTDTAIQHIAQAAARIFPALAGKPVRRSWAGLRPGTPDGRPFLGQDPVVTGLWYAVGHGRNGIGLAAVTGDIIADLYAGHSVEHDLASTSPGRFWT